MNAIRPASKDGSRRPALRAVRMGLPLPGRLLQALVEHAGLRDPMRREGVDVMNSPVRRAPRDETEGA